VHDKPESVRARRQRARAESATDAAFTSALDAAIAVEKRDTAIRSGRRAGLSLRALARATRLSHETIRRIAAVRHR